MPSANADDAAVDQVINHYTCNPRLMPGFYTSTKTDSLTQLPLIPYKIGQIKNSSEIVIAFDGSQYFQVAGIPNGNAHPLGSGVDNWRFNPPTGDWGNAMLFPPPGAESWDNNYGAPVDAVTNADVISSFSGTQQQNVRYRHGRNNSANFLFCDGHVGSFQIKTISSGSTTTLTTNFLRKNWAVNWP